jgi:ABC-2 type transport system permease protein
MLLRTWMIIWKEFIHIFRDWRALAVVIILPVLMLVLYGYAINLDVKHLKLVVYDQDHSQESRDLAGAFSRGEYFDIVAHLDDYDEVTAALDRGWAKAAIVVPIRFAADLASGRTPRVLLIIDGSDSATATTAVGYAKAILQQHSSRLALQALRRRGLRPDESFPPVDLRLRVWYNPELKSTNFIVPGLIAVILTMLAALLTSMTVVRERERGTIEALIVSPVMPYELMLGKLIPYVLIAFVDVIMVIAAGRLLFHVPLAGSPALVLLLSAVFLTAALGIGLLISVLSANQQTAMTIAMLTSMLPTFLLSGFMFPISAMPRPIQLLTNIIPARHFLFILRSVFLKGGGLALLWQPALILLVFGLLLLGISSMRFRKTL